MKSKYIVYTVFLLFSTCLLLLNEAFAQDQLLKAKGRHIYVDIKNDTALLECFIIDKPNRHYVIDKLYYNKNSSIYEGTKTLIKGSRQNFLLIGQDSLLGDKELPLLPMTTRQIKKWNQLHNSYLYNSIADRVRCKRNNLVDAQQITKAHKLDGDWKSILLKTDELDNVSFQREIEAFILKYEIVIK